MKGGRTDRRRLGHLSVRRRAVSDGHGRRLEHGARDPETNVTDDDIVMTAKIARAHLNEFPDYYSRLAVMEAEAEAYWADLAG
jgi:hypothetical protein